MSKRKVTETSSTTDEVAKEALTEQGLDEKLVDRAKSIVIRSSDRVMQDENKQPFVVNQRSVAVTLNTGTSEPQWPIVQPADPVKIYPNKPKPQRTDGWQVAVILPDPQIGYRRLDTEELENFHDEKAIDVALHILAAVRKQETVDRVVNLGDFLDLPGQGKYAQEAGFALTTQLAVNYGHQFLARQRAICPEAKIDVIEGNHDKRLGDYVSRNAMSAFGLRRAGDPPEAWPALSIPNLLRVDDLDINWVEGYPAGGVWLNDHIRCIHGEKVRSSGSTASAVINDSRHSVIFGHVHRIETQHKTDRDRNGPYWKFASSPGCLCRTDGAVPSFHSSVDKVGGSIKNYENWQQGMMVVYYRQDSNEYSIEPIQIIDGKGIWRGKEYVA